MKLQIGRRSKEENPYTLLESRSASQTSSGNRKPFLYIRKLVGIPIMKGVGTNSSCRNKDNQRMYKITEK